MNALILSITLFITLAWSGTIDIKQASSWEIEDYLTPVPTRTQAAAVLKDSIYLIGGQSSTVTGASSNRQVLQLNTATNQGKNSDWEAIASIDESLMPEPWFASNSGASLINGDDDGVYITCEDSRIGHIWRFDTESNEFDIIATMQDLRNLGGTNYKIEDCCSVSVDDKIYIFGGAQFAGRDPDTNAAIFIDVDYTQIYDTANNEWTYGEPLPFALQDASCENVNDEFIYLFGGSNDDNVQDSVYRYDVNDDTWNVYDNVLSVSRRMFGSVYVPNTDYVVLVGGDTGGQFSEEHDFLPLVEAFNIETNQIEDINLPQLNNGRSGAVTVIKNEAQNENKDDNTIYIIGGEFDVDTGVYDNTETLSFKVEL